MNTHIGADILRLCSLGLDSHSLVAKFLDSLHGYIPSYANLYFWADADGDVDDIYDERPLDSELISLCYDEAFIRKQREVFDGWPGTFRHQSTVSMDRLWRVNRKTFIAHEFYNELYRKLDCHHGLHRAIRVDGENHGALQLHRSLKDVKFSGRDIQRLDRVAKHLEYGIKISANGSGYEPSKKPSNTEFITASTSGSIMHYTAGAQRLYMLIHHGNKLADVGGVSFSQVTPMFGMLIKRLLNLSKGLNTEPPLLTYANKWGKFRITAYFMEPVASSQINSYINFQLDHYKPSKVLLLESVESQKLTARQKDVCLNIGLNMQYWEIAEKLGIAKSTVVTHKKEIFDRLGIKSRNQLLNRLLYQ